MLAFALTPVLALSWNAVPCANLPAASTALPVACRLVAAPHMQVDDDFAVDDESFVDSPSDVETIDMPEPEVEPEPAPEPADIAEDEASVAKQTLKSEIADGLAGPRPDKAIIGEVLLALEAQNPTSSPATSPLLEGKWKFLYASGASPGLKALQLLLRGAKNAPKSPSGADLVDVADTYLTIQSEQPRAISEVKVRLLSFENTVKLASELEAESGVRLVETYDAAESDYMSLRLPFQSPVQFKRSVLVSYLDEELLVVRDSIGRPDILMRVDDEGMWATSGFDSGNDDEVPGAS